MSNYTYLNANGAFNSFQFKNDRVSFIKICFYHWKEILIGISYLVCNSYLPTYSIVSHLIIVIQN